MVLRAGRVQATGPVRNVLTPKVVTSVRGDVTFENIVRGVIVDDDRASGTARLAPLSGAPGDAPDVANLLTVPAVDAWRSGAAATYLVASEDVLLLRALPGAISARNVFAARVLGVETLRTDVLVRLQAGALEWRALVTPAAARELEIATGNELFIAVKTHSFTPFG